jgi:hypothetical protein
MDKDERNAYRMVFVFIALVFAAFAVYNLYYLFKVMVWPYDVDYSEAVILATRLQYLYKNFSSYPYLITYYPPLYYFVVGALRAAYQSSLPYFYTRSLAIFATLACTAMLYLIAKKSLGGKSKTRALAPLMFLSALPISIWGVFSGPTQFEVLFDLVAIFVLIAYDNKRAPVYASAALIVAFFFKQTALLVVVAVVAYFLLNRKLKECALFAVTFLIVAVPVTVFLNLLTSGRYILSLFILPMITPTYTQHLFAMASILLLETPFLAFLPFVVYWICKNPKSLLTTSLVFSIAALAGTVKLGSSAVYFMGFFALFCVVSVLGIERVFSSGNRVYRQTATGYMFVAFILITLLVIPKYLSLGSDTFQISQTAEVGLFLRNFSGNVLVESPSVAVTANKSVMFEPSEFGYLMDKGLWNDSQIVSDISMHRFSAIAFPAGGEVTLEQSEYYEVPYGRLVSYPDITKAIQMYYHPSSYGYGWAVFVPNT